MEVKKSKEGLEKARKMAEAVEFCRRRGLLTGRELALLARPKEADRKELALLGFRALARVELWERKLREKYVPMTDEEGMEALQDESRVVWRRPKK